VSDVPVQPPQSCSHSRTEVRRKPNAAKQNTFRTQCLDCGTAVGGCIAAAKVTAIWAVKDWDHRLEVLGDAAREAYWRDQAEQRERERIEQRDEFFREHNKYLRSEKWREKRERVMKRDDWTCQACLKRKATQVHHLNYDHWTDEPLFDLVSVCDVCHLAITEADRRRKQAS
jgi:5-methylcytosine-specific restriction endonuclease McrA